MNTCSVLDLLTDDSFSVLERHLCIVHLPHLIMLQVNCLLFIKYLSLISSVSKIIFNSDKCCYMLSKGNFEISKFCLGKTEIQLIKFLSNIKYGGRVSYKVDQEKQEIHTQLIKNKTIKLIIDKFKAPSLSAEI